MPLYLKDVLNLKPLKEAKLMTGNDRLSHTITGVTIMEAPDIEKSLYGGELVLTSLFSVQDNIETYHELINKLSQKQISALAIKPSRIKKIPEEIIKFARDKNLPVIQLPADIKYIDIIYPVMSELINKQYLELRYFKNLHSDFISASLSKNSLVAIANLLDEKINNPVTIFDRDNQILASSRKEIADYSYHSPVNSFRKEFKNKNSLNAYFKPLIICDVKKSQERKVREFLIPITISRRKFATLQIIELENTLGDLDFIAIEQATTFISLEMAKRAAVTEVTKRFENDLLGQILVKSYSSADYIRNKAQQLNWDLNQSFIAALVRFSDLDTSLNMQDKIYKINNLINSISRIINNSSIVGERNGDIVILLSRQRKKDEKLPGPRQLLNKIVEYSLSREFKKSNYIITYGTKAESLEEIPNSYNEALEAANIGQLLEKYNSIISFEDIGIFRFISKLKEQGVPLTELVPPRLQKLKEYDQENNTELIKTLQTFFYCNDNAKKAAKQLHVHYKTMLYRLERIKEICGLDLKDYKDKLEIQVGLEVIQLLNSSQ